MAAKRKQDEYPKTVKFGAGKVRISRRANGWYALAWREMGSTKKTTKGTEKKALEWAEQKARELDSGSGRQWVNAGEADVIAALRGIAGEREGAVRRLVEDVRGAVKWLDGAADLTAAARWYAENGPLKVERTTATEAIGRFLAEYKLAPDATRRTFATEMNGFLKVAAHADLMLMDLSEARLSTWVRRKVGIPAVKDTTPRTLLGRITTWITFLNRARDWKMLAPGKHAAELLRKPTIPDAGKQILSVDHGRRLLAAVRDGEPKLEAYLLIAGWLGLRPSEVQRLSWEGFEWERGYLHVTTAVAQKTSMERYVPVNPRLLARLTAIYLASGKKPGAKVCGFRSREFLSVLARKSGILTVWPPDVLRHSFCSYRLAVLQKLGQVAEEAGNSAAIIRSNYRRPLRAEDGAAWWSLLDS